MSQLHNVDLRRPARIRVGTLVVVLLSLVAASCASGSTPSLERRGSSNGVVSDFQAELLQDGLTFGEMEFAADEYVRCIERLGIEGEVQYDQSQEVFAYTFRAEDRDVQAVIESEDGAACESEYIGVVQFVWADEVGITPEEDARFYEGVAQCLRSRGFDVPDSEPSTLSYWVKTEPDTYNECFSNQIKN